MPRPLVFLILALPLVGAYAMYASGIVVIYQASRVLNLAHGAMATVPAYLVYTMVERWGIPMGAALPIGVASGCASGILIERVFVRRLRDAGSTAQTVGTVAAFGFTIALAAKIWGTSGLAAPGVFPDGHLNVGNSILRFGQLGILGIAVVATLLLTVLFRRTWLGLAMRGAAVNRRAASLLGVDPDMTSTVAWALGGGLAALAGILLAAVTVLHPYSLSVSVLPAFVAALIGGLESLGAALVGSAIVGLVIGFVPLLADLPGLGVVFGQVGGPELALAVTAMLVMAARGQRLMGTDVRQVAAMRALPKKAAAVLLPRISPRVMLVLLVGWVWLPGIPFTILGVANTALLYTIAAASLVLLTGWIGQISLAQAAFVGVGAFGSVQVAERFGVPFPFTIPIAALLAAAVAAALGVVALRVRGLYLAVATLIFAWMADQYLFSAPWLVGAGGSATADVEPIGYEGGFPYFNLSDRRTFYVVALAGVALVLLGLANLRRSKTGRALLAIRGSEMAAASLGIDVTRYKLMAFALSGAIAGLAGDLLVVDQGTIVPAQFVFTVSLFYLSIAVVGGLQSLGGAVAASVLFAGLNELFFRVDALHGWLDVVGTGLLVAVLVFYPGGLARAPEALASITSRLRALGGRTRFIATSRGAMRGREPVVGGGLSRARPAIRAALGRIGRELQTMGREIGAASDAVLAAAERRAPPRLRSRASRLRAQVRSLRGEARSVGEAARSVRTGLVRFGSEVEVPLDGVTGARDCLDALGVIEGISSSVHRERGRMIPAGDERLSGAVLVADSITVRFGGVIAVQDARIAIRENEIVGLIGPNGAGKTTMFNAIAGFVQPAGGRVLLDGEELNDLQVHERAVRGIGRTFQVIQLAPDMTVLENLLVATHVRNPSGLASDLAVTNRSAIAERRAAERVRAVSELVGLDPVLDEVVGGLPFGTLRMVEVARALATGAPLIMLDEPASGLDEAETQRFADLLRYLREKLGISLLLIEHDVRLVMSLCDYVYVLDQGRLIAEGEPSTVQRDPAVIGAYLGGEPAQPAAATAAAVGKAAAEGKAAAGARA